jgi:ATP synthase protein I
VLASGIVAVLGATAVAAVVAGSVSDRSALLGVLAGAGLVLLVFLFGAFVVGTAARVLPNAALLVALLTYTLQLLVLLLVFVAFRDSAEVRRQLSGDWLGIGMIASTLAWIVGQLVATVRTPIEPGQGSTTGEADAR